MMSSHGLAKMLLQFPRLLQHHPRIPALVAVLQQRAPAGGQFLSVRKQS